jgi:NUMOD4 motif
MTAEWRPVVGYEGLYEVSDDGRVNSIRRTTSQSNVSCIVLGKSWRHLP